MLYSFSILAFIIITFIIMIAIIRKLTKLRMNDCNNIINGLNERRQINLTNPLINEEYNELLAKFIKQDNELDNSIEELKDFRNELEVTYNTLVAKSEKLELSNQILQKRVQNLSNLNNLSRNVLSIFELDKIIDLILDAYFVLTSAKRLSLYLWEDNKLVHKKAKGPIKNNISRKFLEEELKNFDEKDYKRIYEEISLHFIVLNDEKNLIIPLSINDKQLGVIYIIEDKEKLLEVELEMISALAIQASIAINNSKSHNDLLEKERLSQEIELASTIQKRILPENIHRIENLEIISYFEPAKEVGGDYYDYFIKDNIFSINIADVSGKGVPAAFLMALSRSVLKTVYNIVNAGPSEELNLFNKIIFPDISEYMFITMMNLKYNIKNSCLTYSNAGHNPMIIYKKSLNKIFIETVKGVAIGFIQDYNYREKSIFLEDGDIVFMYTDGVTEAENLNKELYGIERLKKVIFDNSTLEINEIRDKVLNSIKEFRGEREQVDDITFVILKYKSN